MFKDIDYIILYSGEYLEQSNVHYRENFRECSAVCKGKMIGLLFKQGMISKT